MTQKQAKRGAKSPRVYLDNFSNGKDQLVEHRIGVSEETTRSAADATTGSELYSVVAVPTEDAAINEEYVSKLWSGIESRAHTVVKDVIKGTWPLTGEQRMKLANYIALAWLRADDTEEPARAPYANDTIEAREALLTEYLQAMYPGLAAEDIAELFAAYADGGLGRVHTDMDIMEIINSLPLLAFFISVRPWTVVRLDKDHSFITSDAPVVASDGYRDGLPIERIGEDRHYVVPVSRKVAIVLAPLPGDDEAARVALSGQADELIEDDRLEALSKAINTAVASNARTHVYRHPDDAKEVPSIVTDAWGEDDETGATLSELLGERVLTS